MTDDMTQEEIEPLIGTDRIDELSEKLVTDLFYQHGECENCGEETISMAYHMRDSEYVCYTCDTEYDPLETEAGKLQIVEKVKERREQRREARAENHRPNTRRRATRISERCSSPLEPCFA